MVKKSITNIKHGIDFGLAVLRLWRAPIKAPRSDDEQWRKESI